METSWKRPVLRGMAFVVASALEGIERGTLPGTHMEVVKKTQYLKQKTFHKKKHMFLHKIAILG